MFLRAQDAPRNVGHSPKWFTSPTRKCRNMFTRKFRYKNTKFIITSNMKMQNDGPGKCFCGRKIYDGYSPGRLPPTATTKKTQTYRSTNSLFFSGQKMHVGHSPGLGPPSNANATHCSEIYVCKYWHLMALAVEGTPHIMTGVLMLQV